MLSVTRTLSKNACAWRGASGLGVILGMTHAARSSMDC